MIEAPMRIADDQVYRIADERIEVYTHPELVVVDGLERPDITGNQLGVLTTLAAKADRTVPRKVLGTEVWGTYDEAVRQRIRVHMYRLRGKLGLEDLGHLEEGAIQTIGNVGYRAKSVLGPSANELQEHTGVLLGNGRVVVDVEGYSMFCDGELMEDVTESEFIVMSTLALNADETVDMPTFQEALWGYRGYAAGDTVRQHIFESSVSAGYGTRRREAWRHPKCFWARISGKNSPELTLLSTVA